ncbi:MAG: type II toxin-antitoxin system VapC family toxin [Alphaproteobacteria bacterium]|nr:type II toxin-antitoxin system VapC family toxin [Alphaproteobacteria bacterium]
MIVLDTNVLSEAIRPKPDAGVMRWLEGVPASSLFATTVTEAELLYGAGLLPAGRRRVALEQALRQLFANDFAGRVLTFDSAAAEAFATIAIARRRAGRPIATFDAQIAAIARAHGASVATRNIADFEDCGVDLVDPWNAPRD